MQLRFATLALAALVATAVSASADTPYENPYAGTGFRNRYSPGQPALRHYGMTKIEVPAGGWEIDTISTNYTYVVAQLDAIDTAVSSSGVHLHIVPDADYPTFDPTGTGDVETNASFTHVANIFGGFPPTGIGLLTVDPTDDIFVGEGAYWIGLTPIVSDPSPLAGSVINNLFGSGGGETVQYAEAGAGTGTSATPPAVEVWSTTNGSSTPSTYTGMSMLITGSTVPEPSTIAIVSIAGLAGLAVIRRRSA